MLHCWCWHVLSSRNVRDSCVGAHVEDGQSERSSASPRQFCRKPPSGQIQQTSATAPFPPRRPITAHLCLKSSVNLHCHGDEDPPSIGAMSAPRAGSPANAPITAAIHCGWTLGAVTSLCQNIRRPTRSAWRCGSPPQDLQPSSGPVERALCALHCYSTEIRVHVADQRHLHHVNEHRAHVTFVDGAMKVSLDLQPVTPAMRLAGIPKPPIVRSPSATDKKHVPLSFLTMTCCSGNRARLTTNVPVMHLRSYILTFVVMCNWLHKRFVHHVTQRKCVMSFVCESEMSQMKVCLYRCTMWKAHQWLFQWHSRTPVPDHRPTMGLLWSPCLRVSVCLCVCVSACLRVCVFSAYVCFRCDVIVIVIVIVDRDRDRDCDRECESVRV